MMRSRPARSVTSIEPSGRNARLHGYSSALVTTTTRMFWPSAVSNSIGPSGSGTSGKTERRDRNGALERDRLLGGSYLGGDRGDEQDGYGPDEPDERGGLRTMRNLHGQLTS